ncbi:MAG: hypothetical protein ACUVX9_03260 [Anaerolineae bacterium]
MPGGETLTYLGEGENLAYLSQLYGATVGSAAPFGLGALVPRVRRLLAAQELVLVEVNRLLSGLLPPGAYRSFPWIRQRVLLRGATYTARRRRIEETFGRKVRRHGYTCRLSRAPQAVVDFYRVLYAPYVKERFGDGCLPRSLAEFAAAVRSGALLEVIHAGLPIAGAVCRLSGRQVTALAFGLRPPYAERLRQGALSAVYYYLFRWAEASGLASIDLLRSRAHACDGVYEHKRRWGAEAEIDPWPVNVWSIYVPPGCRVPQAAEGHLVCSGAGLTPLGLVLTGR